MEILRILYINIIFQICLQNTLCHPGPWSTRGLSFWRAVTLWRFIVHKQALQMQIENINFVFCHLFYNSKICLLQKQTAFLLHMLLLNMNPVDAGHCIVRGGGGVCKYFSSINKNLPQFQFISSRTVFINISKIN